MAGLKSIIALSLVLALGFLLVILSCALWGNWLPLLSAFLFAFAPLPNSIASRCGSYSYSSYDEPNTALQDFARFFTSITLVTGAALPLVLAHAGILATTSSIMSVIGGALIYITIIAFGSSFQSGESDEF
ncbi:vacuolar protein sorting 55 [Wallemia mellicola CBS 633.66]|uniref:Vacuolar protein sorting 55 n=1 Tax=Wallemia mellicola (strain ATCC MYA-4683 / CBS 633.66) TaxID=671144 RepID=I4YA26_WALMC|nr:vacuolar protein sorting 55 [Wallemia mellicola CBS 633.66]EIM20818.1 vacuolar protein sorting 55 [Wallemia mellicola CBS 633.66]|eukprot:XP_006959043.1 vacuolar protein sorting 55 [Wallemia mellicola CBS 633.66]